ncbi:MAG: S-methyl-5'-thioinosine phosphorylase [Halieaceae bacterium]|nr:S-methyl-5'-thioinosine phosphorylase [Halieaceae bacterium]
MKGELVPDRLAVIGGTGLQVVAGFEPETSHTLETPFGAPSGAIEEGTVAGGRCLFLARHGVPHRIAPHRINYRANLWALRQLGADAVLAVNAVGAINPGMAPGQLVVPDQLVDYTWGREHTFYGGAKASAELAELEHVEFTEPYDAGLRQRLVDCAAALGLELSRSATYAATQGPRLETAAEIRRLGNDGCDVVGMTGMPEAALARELGLPYASLCIVVNAAPGLGDEPITLEAMGEVLEAGSAQVARLLQALLN